VSVGSAPGSAVGSALGDLDGVGFDSHCSASLSAAFVCSAPTIMSLSHTCQPRKSSTSTPAVMSSSPSTPTTLGRCRRGRRDSAGLPGSVSLTESILRAVVARNPASHGTHTGRQAFHDRIFVMARSERTKSERPVESRPGEQAPNAVWFKPIMFGFMLLGLIWIIVFYVSGATQLPVPQLGSGNILVGFGIMFIGFLMTTRWR
jgi:hypothetical protein